MKTIGIIFSHAPSENNISKEGLNFVLSASCYTNNINIFFISDGIFHIIYNKNCLCKLYQKSLSSFKILESYNINHFYICRESLSKRKLNQNILFSVQVKIIDGIFFRKKINQCHHLVKF